VKGTDTALPARRLAAGALAFAVTLTACESATPTARTVPTPEPTTAVTVLPTTGSLNGTTRSTVRPVVIAQLTGAGTDTTVTFDVDHLTVGKHISRASNGVQMAVLAFPSLGRRAECVQRVTLNLPAGVPFTDAQVGVYPSAALSLARHALPPVGSGGPATLLDIRPRGLLSGAAPVTHAQFDITELARLWTGSLPFPSRDRTVPPGSPLVLNVRPPAYDDGDYAITIDATTVTLDVDRSRNC
jgi:hypothetical protein